MTPFAFSRGQGSAYAELPPTLQPFAIASAAPPANHLRSAGLSGLIYLLLAGTFFAFSALVPRGTLAIPKPPPPERLFVFDPMSHFPVIHLPPAAAAGQSGMGDATASVQTLVATPMPDTPASTLPRDDHSKDGAGTGNSLNFTPRTAPNPPAVGPAAHGVVHDFSATGLEVLQQVDPAYPEMARHARIQGAVVLLMTVDEAGLPTQVQVLEGHPALREAATRAARQWRFMPARLEGHPVVASFKLTLKFSLR